MERNQLAGELHSLRRDELNDFDRVRTTRIYIWNKTKYQKQPLADHDTEIEMQRNSMEIEQTTEIILLLRANVEKKTKCHLFDYM